MSCNCRELLGCGHPRACLTEESLPEESTATWKVFVQRCSACQREKRLREGLAKIGNVVGGPTMTHAPKVERRELIGRMECIANLVREALDVEKV